MSSRAADELQRFVSPLRCFLGVAIDLRKEDGGLVRELETDLEPKGLVRSGEALPIGFISCIIAGAIHDRIRGLTGAR